MTEAFSYDSPFGVPKDPDQIEREMRAAENLRAYFFGNIEPSDWEAFAAAARSQLEVMGAYQTAWIRSGAEGIADDQRVQYIQKELEKSGYLSPDPAKAAEQFGIFQDGYELNRDQWDTMIGRDRRNRNNFSTLNE